MQVIPILAYKVGLREVEHAMVAVSLFLSGASLDSTIQYSTVQYT